MGEHEKPPGTPSPIPAPPRPGNPPAKHEKKK